ncbi:longitudinals lacking protein, isoforms A/B/D/L isoform X9 [Drosophila busckii]|uniref:longitudinals lacking protein, isoforms A/B/D/L isoform X9 n=1 Tax=Drosophila busckii TaxID=30019 RepID=UPI00083EF779|nr:longitudinals lacking protein, isoforms A/B/D/L isoform X9 [Drosophila busckii]
MDDDQQFCLRWNNHQSTLISVFDTLLENETLVDCTLAAEGKFLKAHKVVLSACSPYFATLLQEQYDKHPIFILKDVKYQELRAMMDYMYRGEVNISQDQLAALLKAAESLQIKGLSDNRSGGSNAAPKPDAHHRVKLSGQYTLEQTKRARHATGGAMDAGDVSGSREGSSSPSRRRRKIRRRSMENDVHDNSNSSVLQAAASNQSILQQAGAGLTAAALVSTQLASGSSAVAANAAALASGSSQVSNQPLTSSSNVTKKTESAKLTSTGAAQGAQQQQQQQQTSTTTTSDAINTDNVQQQQQQQENQGAEGDADDMDVGVASAAAVAAAHTGVVKQLEKSNHKQKIKDNSIQATEMVIEPKAEYDDDAHDENVEDLTLDEEDMTLEELDQAAGTSQGGEGSSQAYGAWQHDRSQDDLGLMAAQDAQQRDPQDIYPILGSLLGVDTTSHAPNSSSNQDAVGDYYGYLNNNNNSSSNNNNNSSGNTTATQSNVANRALHATGAAASSSSSLSRDSFMQCKHCNRYYKSHQKLQEHVRKYCLKQKKYKCISCEYRSRRKDHVLRHAKRKHCMLYERLRNDEESLYLIRNEDDQSNDDNEQDADVDGVEEDAEGGGMDSELAAALCEINFDLAGRDLTITAVPMLQESEEDDDDYDEDG